MYLYKIISFFTALVSTVHSEVVKYEINLVKKFTDI